MIEKCHCGLGLHYTDKETFEKVQSLVDQLGSFLDVTVGAHTYRVQRHYIALHGIKGKDVSTLGFKEVSDA